MKNVLKFGLLFAVALALVACGSPRKKAPEPVDFGQSLPEPIVIQPTMTQNVKHNIGNPAVMDLWKQSETARKSGDNAAAVMYLERALRIEPTDGVLWSRLAELQLRKGDPAQAESAAMKSNDMAGSDAALTYRNWLIIGRAREQKGDMIGAEEARGKASDAQTNSAPAVDAGNAPMDFEPAPEPVAGVEAAPLR
ncbi:MAG: tetratricopeptide repeat protein [Gammaproteobacteria bacterium]|nr:tetratricopeptide repeat protein [Gammaproteobacteria bacterium]